MGEEMLHNLVSPGGVFSEEVKGEPPGKKQPGITVQGDAEDTGIMGVVLKEVDYFKSVKSNFGVDIADVPGRFIALLQFRNHIFSPLQNINQRIFTSPVDSIEQKFWICQGGGVSNFRFSS